MVINYKHKTCASLDGFDLDYFAVIGVSFCIRLPNFVQIGTSAVEI